jgi:mRNA interferase HigB
MFIVTGKHLARICEQYPDAASELLAWEKVIRGGRWRNFVELQQSFSSADAVMGYVVFNIRHNRYRLITVMHYAKDTPVMTKGTCYLRSFLTHKQYDNPSNWDKEFGK